MASSRAAQRQQTLTVALIGNPNTGKSTLFNALAGMQSRVGNYPGVTVEKKIGRVRWNGRQVSLVDLPGTYSLSPRTRDEMVSVDVLLGRLSDMGRPDVVVCIVDAANIERNLYLFSQLLDLGLPTVLVLNMTDVAAAGGMSIDAKALSAKLGIPVVATQAHRKEGMDEVRAAIESAIGRPSQSPPRIFPTEFYAECRLLAEAFDQIGVAAPPPYLLERSIIDVGGQIETDLGRQLPRLNEMLPAARERLRGANCRVPSAEARLRYAWVRNS